MPRVSKEKESLNLALTKELWARIAKEAEAYGVSRTAWIQMTLMNYFKGIDSLGAIGTVVRMAEDEKKKNRQKEE